MNVLYRYDGCANFDGFCCTEYKILRETECGWWIKYDNNYIVAHNNKAEKWVSKSGKKRFCYPTKLEALNSLYHRQNMRIKILNSQLTISHNLRSICINLLRKMGNENV